MKKLWIIPAVGSAIAAPMATSEHGPIAWLTQRPTNPPPATGPGPVVQLAGMLGIGAAQDAGNDPAYQVAVNRTAVGDFGLEQQPWPQEITNYRVPELPEFDLQIPHPPGYRDATTQADRTARLTVDPAGYRVAAGGPSAPWGDASPSLTMPVVPPLSQERSPEPPPSDASPSLLSGSAPVGTGLMNAPPILEASSAVPSTVPAPGSAKDDGWLAKSQRWIGGLLPGAPGSAPATASGVTPPQGTLPGAPSDSVASLIRFNMTPEELTGAFDRVTNLSADHDLRGMRVAVTTGAKSDDLAGSLTYYFDHHRQVQRISFSGYTGDARRLIAHVGGAYGLTSRPTLGAGLYVAEWNGQETSVLVLEHPTVMRDDTPRTNQRFLLEVNRPGAYFALTDEMRARLDSLSARGISGH